MKTLEKMLLDVHRLVISAPSYFLRNTYKKFQVRGGFSREIENGLKMAFVQFWSVAMV